MILFCSRLVHHGVWFVAGFVRHRLRPSLCCKHLFVGNCVQECGWGCSHCVSKSNCNFMRTEMQGPNFPVPLFHSLSNARKNAQTNQKKQGLTREEVDAMREAITLRGMFRNFSPRGVWDSLLFIILFNRIRCLVLFPQQPDLYAGIRVHELLRFHQLWAFLVWFFFQRHPCSLLCLYLFFVFFFLIGLQRFICFICLLSARTRSLSCLLAYLPNALPTCTSRVLAIC